MILPYQEIKKLIESEGLVSEFKDLNQLDSAGFDLRLGKVYEMELHAGEGVGSLKANGERTLPKLKLVAGEEGETVYFHKGTSYILETMERVRLPVNLSARIQPRLTTCLIGLRLQTSRVSPGYRGGLRFSAFCSNPCKVEVGSLFSNIVFEQLTQDTEKPYKGFYQDKASLQS